MADKLLNCYYTDMITRKNTNIIIKKNKYKN